MRRHGRSSGRSRSVFPLVVVTLLTICACSGGKASPRSVSVPHARPHRAAPAHAGGFRSCFPSLGACGYPDPAYRNVGPSVPCAQLPPSGSISTASRGQIIENLHVIGQITIRNPDVTVNNVCVTFNGRRQSGSTAVQIAGGSHATIENSIIAGANPSSGSVQIAVSNFGAPAALLRNDEIYNCGECIHDEPWTVTDTYVLANGMQGTGDHTEPVYINDGTLVATHDSLLLPPHPSPQVADVFANVNDGNPGPCRDHVVVRDSMLAGGGFPLELCAHGTSLGTSTTEIVNNRFARCVTHPFAYNPSTGGTACGAYRGPAETLGHAGEDAHGYWPQGGYYGVAAGVSCPPKPGQLWAGNVWDDNGASVRCP